MYSGTGKHTSGKKASGGDHKHRRAKRYNASAVIRKKEAEQYRLELADLLEEAETGGICFYDSEFGMYNYGDRQGDVVLIGACTVEPEFLSEAAEQEPLSEDTEPGSTSEARGMTPAVFSELIRNTEEEQLGERFYAFTGIKKEALFAARPFPEVFADFCAFVREHHIRRIYCLGNNDIERLSYMMERYGITDARSREVLSKFCNFQKWLTAYDRRISGFSLESLAALCEVSNERAHDALSDALTLYRVWAYLSANRCSDARIQQEIEAAHQRSRYKKSRRVTFERMPASAELLAARDLLVSELEERNRKERYISASVLRAICDDLDALLVPE